MWSWVTVTVAKQLGKEHDVGLTPVQRLAVVCVCPPHNKGQLAVSP